MMLLALLLPGRRGTSSVEPPAMRFQKPLRLVEALLRRMLVVAGMGAHGEAVAGAVVEPELTDFAELAHPGLHPTHIRDRSLLVFRAVHDQHGGVHSLGEVVRLRAGLGVRRPEGESVKDDDHADLLMRPRGHERVHPTAAEAEHRQGITFGDTYHHLAARARQRIDLSRPIGLIARRSTATHSAVTWPSGPSALSTLGLTSPIISSIERSAALCGVLPTLNEKHTCTGLVARISATSLSATVSTLPISRLL